MKKVNVFLIEDEPLLVKALKIKFKKENVTVVSALDGAEALEKIFSYKPDVILLDLWLPKVDGFEVMRKIKKDKSFSKVPIVVFSNLNRDVNEIKVKKLGVYKFINKSNINIDDLVREIKKVIKK